MQVPITIRLTVGSWPCACHKIALEVANPRKPKASVKHLRIVRVQTEQMGRQLDCPFNRPTVQPSVRPTVRPTVRPIVRPSIRPTIRLSVRASDCSTVCASVNMVIDPRIYYHVASNMIIDPWIAYHVAGNLVIDPRIYRLRVD